MLVIVHATLAHVSANDGQLKCACYDNYIVAIAAFLPVPAL